MQIDHLDQLKAWLAKKLEPICDADPSALAKYVIALVKKDKVEAELQALCEDQLDVFLGIETKPFVADLFVTLESKSYVPANIITGENLVKSLSEQEQKGKKRKSFEDIQKEEAEKVVKTENKPDVGKIAGLQNENINTLDNMNKNTSNTHNSKDTSKYKNENISNLENEFDNKTRTKIDMNDENNKELIDKKDNDDISMRGVSQDRSMKSMSPAIRSKHHSSRRRSSKSPNRSSSNRHPRSSRRTRRDHRDRSRDRRGRRRGDKEKCRDYEEKGFCMLGEVCPYDHGQDPVEVDDRNLPQMLTLAGIPSSQQQQPTQIPPPLQIFPNMVPPRPIMPAGASGSLTLNTGLTTVQVQKPRPIPSPVELSGSQVPIFRPRNPIAFIRNASPPVTPVTVQGPGLLPSLQVPVALSKISPANGEPYNPEEPSITEVNENKIKKEICSSLETNEVHTTDRKDVDKDNLSQNELVQIAMGNVPLTPIVGSQANVFQLNGVLHPNHPTSMQPPRMVANPFVPDLLQQAYLPPAMSQQQQHYQQQLQMQQQHQQQQQQNFVNQQQSVVQVPVRHPYRKNTVLEIRKIPAELNNMVKLSEHFQKFGTITKIQTPFENDSQAALLEFATYQQATAAYSSPEAILGNRFIKMFWHNPNRQNKQQHTNNNANKNNVAATSPDTLMDASNAPPQIDTKPKKIATSEELRYVNPNAVDPKVLQAEKKKELEKLKQELAKKKQTNYEELVKKQKDIYAKLADKNLNQDEKARLLKAFKHCDVTAQKLKKELMEDAQKLKLETINASPTKSFRDPKKEILDREIDIYHGNLEGDELLQAKEALEELKREMYGGGRSRGRGGYRGRVRGRGAWYRGRGRGAARGGFQAGSSSVDNRPKQILVSGYDASEKEEIAAHFATFGQLDRIEETAVDKMVLTFPSRQSAEVAAIQGGEFNGKTLVLAWFTGVIKSSETPDSGATIQRRMTRSLSQSIMDKDLDDELLELDKEEEEMLLAGVDDDEDDDEEAMSSESNDRSWRR